MVSLRWKLVTPFVLIVALVVMVLVPITNRLVERGAEAEADRQLQRLADVALQLMETSARRAQLEAVFLAGLPEARAAGSDPAQLAQALAPARSALELQEVSFFPAAAAADQAPVYSDGAMAAHLSQRLRAARAQLVQQVRTAGAAQSYILIEPGSSQMMGAAEVFDPSGQPSGVLLAAYYLDENYMRWLSQMVGADLAVVRDNQVIVSTLDPANGYQALLEQGFIDPSGALTTRTLRYGQSAPQRLLAHPLELNGRSEGALLVAQPVETLFQIRRDIQWALFAFAAAVTTISLVFGLAASASFVQLLTRLGEAIHLVSTGRWEQRAPVAQLAIFPDEISKLGEDFDLMTARLQDLYGHLERQLQDRTRELLAEHKELDQIRRERDQAQQAERERAAGLARLSHSLRSPLNSILGYAELLGEEARAAGQTQLEADLEKITAAARRELALIQEWLGEPGQAKAPAPDFDPVAWLVDMQSVFQPAAESKGLRLEAAWAARPAPGRVRADPARARQALAWVLNHVMQTTKQGVIRLDAATDGEWVELIVSQPGPGQTPEQLEALFSPVEGAEPGLPQARQWCGELGGQLLAESGLEQGVTFRLRWPRATAA